MRIFKSVQEAYLHSLKDIRRNGKLVASVTDPSSIGSSFGKRNRDFIELLGYSFVLSNPRDRLIYSKSRRISFGFNIANLIWMLSGRKDVETISFYNKLGNAYSDNGVYYEAAFGDRIFGNHQLWQAAEKLLKRDESTRRALMPIFIPNDLKTLPKDAPCAASIQVMARENSLDFFLHMRSQSVAMVFPYDIFLFTMLHEFMGLILKLPIGRFFYYCNSFHYYEEEAAIVEKILSEDSSEPEVMEHMSLPDGDSVKDIVDAEIEIRTAINRGVPVNFDRLKSLPNYWKNMIDVLYYKASIDSGIKPIPLRSQYLINQDLFV